MVNRRHIRIKVMQSIYAVLQSKSDNLPKEEKFLFTMIIKDRSSNKLFDILMTAKLPLFFKL